MMTKNVLIFNNYVDVVPIWNKRTRYEDIFNNLFIVVVGVSLRLPIYVKYDFCENNFIKVQTRFVFPITIMTIL